jgi:hypothetical protein
VVFNVNIVHGNLKSKISQDYAQKPQGNCTFMNSASVFCCSIKDDQEPKAMTSAYYGLFMVCIDVLKRTERQSHQSTVFLQRRHFFGVCNIIFLCTVRRNIRGARSLLFLFTSLYFNPTCHAGVLLINYLQKVKLETIVYCSIQCTGMYEQNTVL